MTLPPDSSYSSVVHEVHVHRSRSSSRPSSVEEQVQELIFPVRRGPYNVVETNGETRKHEMYYIPTGDIVFKVKHLDQKFAREGSEELRLV